MIFTIDGPTASGKSSIARDVARKLGISYLCSGLLYRALAYELLTQYNYSPEACAHPDPNDIAVIVSRMEYGYEGGTGAYVMSDGTRYDAAVLKSAAVDDAASRVSAVAGVRPLILELQRLYAHGRDVIVEGRDVGTVVFPHADVKIFLTASLEVRARRWLVDQLARGKHFTLHAAEDVVQERDRRDSTRACAPLVIPDGATIIDTTHDAYDIACAKVYEAVQAARTNAAQPE